MASKHATNTRDIGHQFGYTKTGSKTPPQGAGNTKRGLTPKPRRRG